MARALPLFGLFYDTVAGTAFAYPLWSRTLKHLPASTAGLEMLLCPVFGVMASAILLEERSIAAEFAGFALILAAAVLALEPDMLRIESFTTSPHGMAKRGRLDDDR